MGSDEKKPKAQRLRDYIIGYKRAHPSCRFCPAHPHGDSSWNSGRGYFRLVCKEGNHSVNIFSMLANFDLSPVVSDAGLRRDLAYVRLKYIQVKGIDAPFQFPIPDVSETKLSIEDEKELEEEPILKPGTLCSSRRIQYTAMGESAGQAARERLSSEISESSSISGEDPCSDDEPEWKAPAKTIGIKRKFAQVSQKQLGNPFTPLALEERPIKRVPPSVDKGDQSRTAYDLLFLNKRDLKGLFLVIHGKVISKLDKEIFPIMESKGNKVVDIDDVMENVVKMVFADWCCPDMIGGYNRATGCGSPTLEEFYEGRVAKCFDTPLRTYSIKVRPKPITPNSYAEATKSGIPENYHENLRKTHEQKLRSNPEYAAQYLKSGRPPKPIRRTHEIGFIYTQSKRLKRSEVRIGLRAIGIETGKIIDINFIGSNVTVLTVPKEQMHKIDPILRSKGLLIESFNPLSPETNRFDKEEKSPAIRFAERMLRMKDEAAKRGKLGLANFYKYHLATQLASLDTGTMDHEERKYKFPRGDDMTLIQGAGPRMDRSTAPIIVSSSSLLEAPA